MITEKIFEKDVYLKELNSTLLSISEDGSSKEPHTLVLDKTIFFPEGGGQPCDLGEINGISVVDVYEKEGIVYHVLDWTNTQEYRSKLASMKQGDSVHSVLDWPRRFNHMQRHCGEHILSAIFYEEMRGINRGFHMGENYMTIDIDVKDLSWEQCLQIELKANEMVWADVPVTTKFFESREEAAKHPLRKELALDEGITIVCVGDDNNPAGCVACCGTHPSTTGQVGLIKIIKAENYKGMTRVYFKAGLEALLDYQNKDNIITKLNVKYSSDENGLLEKIRIQDEKNKAVRQELHDLKTWVVSSHAEELRNLLATSEEDVLVREYGHLTVDDLLHLGRKVTEEIKGLLILTCQKEKTLLFFSQGDPHCGKLIKENVGIYNGKGGGNATSARALFSKEEYLETFIDLIKKHLR
ncbi:MAG: alanyl-tRNA editing protein [Anaerovoracaceae bacterium]